VIHKAPDQTKNAANERNAPDSVARRASAERAAALQATAAKAVVMLAAMAIGHEDAARAEVEADSHLAARSVSFASTMYSTSITRIWVGCGDISASGARSSLAASSAPVPSTNGR
jgi:hypothetical protein